MNRLTIKSVGAIVFLVAFAATTLWAQRGYDPRAERKSVPAVSSSVANTKTQVLDAWMTGLDASQFPYVFANVAVNYNGAPISTLGASNFVIKENGVTQTGCLSITPPSSSGGVRRADIVFLMDNSGSMSTYQAAVSANVLNFVDSLTARGVDFALGLCRFGQYGPGTYRSVDGDPLIVNNGILTTDARYFKDSLWAKQTIDGGTEPGYDALTYSSRAFSFRPGAQRIFIIIGDETPNQGIMTIDSAKLACVSKSITVFALTDSLYLGPEYSPITSATNGSVFSIYSSFTPILNAISTQIANTYVLRYCTSDPNRNGIPRMVEVLVNYQAYADTARGTYTPGQAPLIVRTAATIALHNQAWAQSTQFTIAVTITDNSAPYTSSATLFYRTTGVSSFSSVAMTNVSGNTWQGIIPGSAAQQPGVDYYITATDGQSTSSDPSTDPALSPYQLAILPNVAPAITHTPPATLTPGQALTIAATVVDNTNSLSFVEMHYRKTGTLVYKTVTPTVSGSSYTWTIPAVDVTSDGIDYYLYAEDNFGVGSYDGTPDHPHQVQSAQSTAQISVQPASLSASLAQNDSTTRNLVISNLGVANLNFVIGSAASPRVVAEPPLLPGSLSSEIPDASMHMANNVTTGKLIPSYVPASKIVMATEVHKSSSTVNVLWDLTHGVYFGYEPVDRYSSLVTLLTGQGFTVTTTTSIGTATLANYNILVIGLGSAWNSPYSAAEVTAIQNFVAQGGSLLILGDNNMCPNANINPVGAIFGVAFGGADLASSLTTFPQHALFTGVSSIYIAAGGAITVPAAASVVNDGTGKTAIAYNTGGKGKLLFIGDINLWENSYLTNSNNTVFATNAFGWLAVGFGGTPKSWVSVNPMSGTVPPSTNITVIVRFTSVGMQPGTYLDTLVISSNDPQNPKVRVPLSMTVSGQQQPALMLSYSQVEASTFPVIKSYVTVSGSDGTPITGLTASNFNVQEDGVTESPITVVPVGSTGNAISVGLLLDKSGSMSGTKITDAKTAANTFVTQLQSGDKAAVISFGSNVVVNQDFTGDKGLLTNAVNSIGATDGTTAIFDGLYEAVSRTSTQIGRKAIILLTDGDNNAGSYTIHDAVSFANQQGIPVFTVGLGITLGSYGDTTLAYIAAQTGGLYFRSATSADLVQIYNMIAQHLQHQYLITYTTHNPAADGSVRTVHITVNYNSLTDDKEKQYTAPSAQVCPPHIVRIYDVPNDHGRQVFVQWSTCRPAAAAGIAKFGIWRKDAVWTFVKDALALNDTLYQVVAQTIFDSTKTKGMYWSVFKISAHGLEPYQFAVSNPDSGYSLDNLPPSVPVNIVASSITNSVTLRWNGVPENDLQYYRVYRSSVSGFTPDAASYLDATADTTYVDLKVTLGATYYYKLVAVDFSGNRSDPSAQVTVKVGTTGVDNLQGSIPTEFSLSQNFPNPFNPSTVIEYAIPERGMVQLKVFSVLGVQVATLVGEYREPGTYAATWNAAGLPSGMYLYKMTLATATKTYEQSRKLVLLK